MPSSLQGVFFFLLLFGSSLSVSVPAYLFRIHLGFLAARVLRIPASKIWWCRWSGASSSGAAFDGAAFPSQHVTLWLCQNSYGKSPFFMGKSTINGIKWPFSIAIVTYPEGISLRAYTFLDHSPSNLAQRCPLVRTA